MKQDVDVATWQNAQKRYPQLKDFEELKHDPQNFIAAVKSLHEIEVMEANGDESLSVYKNPAKIMKIIDEIKPFTDFFSEVAEKDAENIPFDLYDDYSACITLLSNDNLAASPTFDILIKNKSGLPEIAQMRKTMISGLAYNLPQYLDYKIGNTTENAKEVTNLIEDDPKAVMALIAISKKNKESGLPEVKIFSPQDLKIKMENYEVQNLAKILPLTRCYGYAVDYAESVALPVKNMDLNRALNIESVNALHSSYVHTVD